MTETIITEILDEAERALDANDADAADYYLFLGFGDQGVEHRKMTDVAATRWVALWERLESHPDYYGWNCQSDGLNSTSYAERS